MKDLPNFSANAKQPHAGHQPGPTLLLFTSICLKSSNIAVFITLAQNTKHVQADPTSVQWGD